MDRRMFLAAGLAAACGPSAANSTTEPVLSATALPLPTSGLPLGPLPDLRYPDPHIEPLDKRFAGNLVGTAVERVATGFRWAEGPAYFPAGRYLVFSDIPNNRLMRLSEDDNHLSVFRAPSMNANGNAVDRQGRLVTCEGVARRVTRTEVDGSISVLADRWQGKRLNSPNDLAIAPDGAIWFTDPSYSIDNSYMGLRAEREQAGNHVYRIDPGSGRVTKELDGFDQPNGICFSPDGRRLYVVDSGDLGHVRVFDFDSKTGRARGDSVFVQGWTDGLRCDTAGNVWCSMGLGDDRKEDGVRCYSPEGALLGKIHLPESCANLAFGGVQRNRLYMCASTSIYAVYVDATGAG